MKNIGFYIAIVILAVGATWLAVICFDQKKQIGTFEAARSKQARAVVTEAKEISRQVDEKGIEQVIFDVTANRTTHDDLNGKQSTKGLIDTTAMALDIRTKQLQQITVIKSTLEAENLILKRQLDAARRPFYTYSGNGLNLKFTPPDEKDSTSVARADFSANVEVKATQYWTRKWFLGTKKSILAVSSNSPLYKINGADFVEFEQQQPTWGLRIQAGVNFNPQTGSVGFGPAARFDAGRVSLQGNYTWYPESGRWRPSVNANFDLIRF